MVCCSFVYEFQTWILLVTLILITLFLYKNQRYRWIYRMYKTLPRDLEMIFGYSKVTLQLRMHQRNLQTIPKLFKKTLKKHPHKVAFYFEDDPWTYQKLEDFSNKVANYFREQGYGRGNVVALLLENRPEYVGIWLGLAKVGIVTALINTNLVSSSLYHSIIVANSKAVIYGSDYVNAIGGITDKLGSVKLYQFNTSGDAKLLNDVVDIKAELRIQSASCPEQEISMAKPNDTLIYIYTSGTTGLPKAAKISHARYMFACTALYHITHLRNNDICYNPLPLYHSSGGMLGVGNSLMFGMSVVLRKKFSASNFWNDCAKYKCTVSNYIGEICSYILEAHKNNNQIIHNLRQMMGNGLRRDIWEKFTNTFNIPHIYEFYGSTEGNSNLVNIDNTVGSVGFIPIYLSKIYPLALLKCEEDTKEPIRGENGLCIRCKPGETGILAGKIVQNNSIKAFTGYADERENNKKIIRNVFKKGDTCFNSGDLLVQDEFGYFFFKDRTGDTYRWKGENVATTEIESIISTIIEKNISAVVYGVQIPNTEGRAGMIAIVDQENKVNLNELAKGLKSHLPKYAIPLFLRVMTSLPLTGTFKVRKVKLQEDGFNVNEITDPLYFYDAQTVSYVPLNDVYDSIMTGKLKL